MFIKSSLQKNEKTKLKPDNKNEQVKSEIFCAALSVYFILSFETD